MSKIKDPTITVQDIEAEDQRAAAEEQFDKDQRLIGKWKACGFFLYRRIQRGGGYDWVFVDGNIVARAECNPSTGQVQFTDEIRKTVQDYLDTAGKEREARRP